MSKPKTRKTDAPTQPAAVGEGRSPAFDPGAIEAAGAALENAASASAKAEARLRAALDAEPEPEAAPPSSGPSTPPPASTGGPDQKDA